MAQTGAVIDIERIRELASQVDAALVLHGSSGVDDASLQAAIAACICKVNLSTALQRVFMQALRASANEPGHETDARAVLADARDAVTEEARRRIRLLGAARRG
jgi:fructose-bisphosphate aldolase class II